MGRAGRPTVAIELSDDERDTLRRWARRHKSSQALALRSRIVLACAEGETNTVIAAELGCNKVTVAKWRHRFAADRLEGLTDAPRPGAARTTGDDVVEAITPESCAFAKRVQDALPYPGAPKPRPGSAADQGPRVVPAPDPGPP